MKFRLSAQPKPKEFRSNIPSHLLSDPAFSADPHLNPYSVNNRELAWATPPLGHPVLKNKNRGPVAKLASHNGIIATADFDFQLLQPPNSPVSYVQVGGGSHNQDTPSFPFPTSLNTAAWTDTPPSPVIASTATASSSLVPRSQSPVTSTVPTIKFTLPAKDLETKKKRMPFLSRRKSTHTTSSNLAASSTSSISKLVLTADNGSRTTTSSRSASAPILSVPKGRPVLPPRAATSGTSTPRSTATSISGSSKRLGEGRGARINDLDRIDELDETNPWGLSLHHDGPYQAATQALKRGDNMSLGIGSSVIDDYAQSEMQSHGKAYVPPQAPTGISLNLSPGQILPRNFGEQRVSPPRMRDTSVRPPRMQQTYPQSHSSLSRSQSQIVASPTSSIPPRHLNRLDPRPDAQPEPSRQRRQSQPPLSPATSPFPNPHPIIPIESVASTGPNHFPSTLQTPLDSYLRIDPPIAPDQYPQSKSRPNSLYQRSLDSRSDSYSSSDLSRRHSEKPRRSFVVSNPGPEPSPPAVPPRDIKAMDKLKESQYEDTSVDIGMAMLHSRESESETLVIPTPRIFLPQGTPDHGEDFNPYDPIHLEKGHSRTPSPSALVYDNSSHSSHDSSGGKSVRESSRRPSPVRSLEVPNAASGRPMRTSEQPVPQKQTPLLAERNNIDPPPYTLLVPDNAGATLEHDLKPLPSQTVAQSNVSSSNTFPERVPSKNAQLASSEEPRRWERETATQSVINDDAFPIIQRPDAVSVVSQQHPVNSAMTESQDPQTQSVEPTAYHEELAPPAGQQVMPMLPARRSRERLAPSVMTTQDRDRDRDARSTHQSFSTGSSGYTRSGPPPRIHVPKRLVMPAPLNVNNNNNNTSLNGFASPPRMQPSLPAFHNLQRQVPPRHAQVAFQPQVQVYYPPPPIAPAPNAYIPPPAIKKNKEVSVAASRKLKKRTSVMPPPPAAQVPPAPILSTVSFAAPVIGYGHPIPVDKTISRLKNEKIPKRVLSKQRRTEV